MTATPSTEELQGHLARMAQDGTTIVEDAIEPALVDELGAAVGAAVARLERELAIAPAGNLFEGRKTLRVYNLLARGKLFERLPVPPRILPIIEGVLDKGGLVSSLSSTGFLPGETGGALASDGSI